MSAHPTATRSTTMVGTARHSRRLVPLLPGFLHRQHRAARDTRRSGRTTVATAIRGGGLWDRLRGVADHRWAAGRHLRAQARVPAGDRRIHAGLGPLWPGDQPDDADRARVLQAIMAATLTPQVLAIIRVEFAPHERPFAIGLYGTSMGFASIVAQVLGGGACQLGSFRLVVAPDLSDQYSDRLGGGRLCGDAGNRAVPSDPRWIC